MITFYGLAIDLTTYVASFREYFFNWTSLLQYGKKLFINIMITICSRFSAIAAVHTYIKCVNAK